MRRMTEITVPKTAAFARALKYDHEAPTGKGSPAPLDELLQLLNGFIASDLRLRIWRDYPDLSEADDNYTDGWACEEVSTEFAAFARWLGWDAVVVHGNDPEEGFVFDHAWVRLTRNGAVVDVDWTARQYHNLYVAEGHDPNVLTLPWPLTWDPALVGENSHLIVGQFAAVTKEDR